MGPSPSSSRRIAAVLWRRRGLTLALLLLSSFALRVAHWVATPHQLCARHGMLEHQSGEQAEQHVLAEDVPTYRGTEASHEECTIGQCARVEVWPRCAFPQGSVVLTRLDETRAPTSEPVPDEARYRQAPSRSPPV